LDEKRMGLVGHLSDLKKMITWIILGILAGFIIGYWKVDVIYGWMLNAIPVDQLAFYSPAEGFMVEIKIAFFAGLVLGFPVICWALAWFIFPGLTPKERVWMPVLVLAGVALFFIGCLVVMFAAMPSVLKFLFYVTADNMEPMISLSKYLAFTMSMIIAGGVTMLIPYVILVLIVTGIVPAEFFARRRLWIIGIIFSIGLIMSSGLDLMTIVILFVPAYLLFELALFLGRKWRQYIDKTNEKTNNVGGEVQ